MSWAILTITAFAVVYVGLVVGSNRLARPSDRRLAVVGAGISEQASDRLTIFDWNLGYAGLGVESEFIADGGRRVLAPSPGIVDKNLAGILEVLRANPADVYALQEASIASPLNYNRKLWDRMEQSLPGAVRVWLPDLRSQWFPLFLRFEHGLGTVSRVRIGEARSVVLPLEPKFWFGLLRKQYAVLVARMPIADRAGNWVVINLHLAAFDENGTTRRRQLGALLDLAQTEYRNGNGVILAGDWNMLLGGPEFPHTTERKYLEWVQPLPADTAPSGWQFAYDPATPTVRSLHKPYVSGENFVGVIDGFMVSPNVEVETVRTLDLGFQFSDHNPVCAVFRFREMSA